MGSPMAVGDRVIVDGMAGEVSFLGEDLPDLPAGSWVGVVYDEPVGKNDGTVKGRRLFKCKKNHGHLVRPEKVKVCFAETALKRQAMGMMGPSVGHAARSHEANDRYMENFENAYAMLQGGDPSSLYAGRAGAGSSHGCGGRDGDPRRLLVQEIPGSGGVSPVRSRMVGKSGAASASGHCEVSQIGSQLETMSLLGTQSSWWSKGPSDPKGTEIDVSDRPNTCISIRGNEAVIGSTDHALYAIDIHKGVKTRTLYSKACGHTEWVTCVTHLSDGRVVSGGMDGKLCLWNAAGARCSDLKGHTGSITAVRANKASGVLVSASYDATLAIWDSCRHPSRALSSTLRGHKAPITALALGPHGEMLSGGRDGMAFVWDIAKGCESRRLGAHGGHVTSCLCFGANLLLTGAQDGRVRVWDARGGEGSGKPLHTVAAHVLGSGSGAVGDMILTSEDGHVASHVITAGADGRVQVLEPRNGFTPLHTLTSHKDFIYSLAVAGKCVLSGDGKGMLLVHEWQTGKLCYGLGANSAAVRCIGVCSTDGHEALVTSGDDGNILVYHYH